MLLRLTFENVLCFKNEVLFSMVASQDEQHPEHLLSERSSRKIAPLKASAIYGANGHGKTKFVEAVAALRNLVVKGTKLGNKYLTTKFRLDPACDDDPTRFVIEYRVGSTDYEYGILFDNHRIVEEWLYEVKQASSDIKLFERETGADLKSEVSFGRVLLNSESPSKKISTEIFLQVISEGLDAKQPFLTEAVDRKVSFLEPAYRWFKNTLTPVSADSHYRPLHKRLMQEESFIGALGDFLKNVDVGINDMKYQETPFSEDQLPRFPSSFQKKVRDLEEGNHVTFGNQDGSLLAVAKRDNVFVASAITMLRKGCDDAMVTFDLDEESSGTRRVIDLFPMLASTSELQKVFVVDELDRKLHPILARHLLTSFLEKTSNQIIYTTHNTHLLDLAILRRDEIWFVQKKMDGSSVMYSLADMKIRHDLDVRKGYLNGRFGAIPFLGNLNDLGWVEGSERDDNNARDKQSEDAVEVSE